MKNILWALLALFTLSACDTTCGKQSRRHRRQPQQSNHTPSRVVCETVHIHVEGRSSMVSSAQEFRAVVAQAQTLRNRPDYEIEAWVKQRLGPDVIVIIERSGGRQSGGQPSYGSRQGAPAGRSYSSSRAESPVIIQHRDSPFFGKNRAPGCNGVMEGYQEHPIHTGYSDSGNPTFSVSPATYAREMQKSGQPIYVTVDKKKPKPWNWDAWQ
ncbi:MAG: hypothetical protein V4664_04175 [Patescibacteria group bacterium]